MHKVQGVIFTEEIMSKIAIMTDSNSGITQAEGAQAGIYVLPMPFYINEEMLFEEIDLSQEEFYGRLTEGAQIKTSMPTVGSVTDMWKKLLQDYEKVVYIPMSSGLSSSCETAYMLSQDAEFEGRVYVVDNQRISVTQRQSVFDAKTMADEGRSAEEIRDVLLEEKFHSSIYIMVDTLTYLKRGGRITPAAAALGTLLRLKPVLQIQGEKLDAFAKARTVKQAKTIMLDAMKKDFAERFGDASGANMHLEMAYTYDLEAAEQFRSEVQAQFPNHEIVMNPLSLSVSCHIGPGALAIASSHRIGAPL